MALRVDLLSTAQTYMDNQLKAIPGLKALLVDEDMRNIISAVYTHSQLLLHQVVLVDAVASLARRRMPWLKAVVLVRPSRQSILDLSSEVGFGNFSEYHVCFTNLVEPDQLQALSNADTEGLVRSVHEVFLDFLPLTEETSAVPLYIPHPDSGRLSTQLALPMTEAQWDKTRVVRVVNGLSALFLAMKRRPAVRYRAGSRACEALASELGARMRSLHYNFPDVPSHDCVAIIIDRRDDPVTPLLTQWTYQAMVHDYLGIVDGNKVVLDGAQGTDGAPPTDEERIQVLSPQHDAFFALHRYSNWGDVGVSVHQMMQEYKKHNDGKPVTPDDLHRIASRLPELKHQFMLASRHVNMASDIGDEVKSRNLFALSLIEQDVVASDNHATHARQVREAVQDPANEVGDCLRLVMLYALRYEGRADAVTAELTSLLQQRRCPPEKLRLVEVLQKYAGRAERVGDVFRSSEGGLLQSVVRAAGLGFDGGEAQNVFTQHEPWVRRIVNRLYNDDLPATEYPYQRLNANNEAGGETGTERIVMTHPKDIVVFVVGGATYEEVLFAHNVNAGTVPNKPPDRQVSEALKSGLDSMAKGVDMIAKQVDKLGRLVDTTGQRANGAAQPGSPRQAPAATSEQPPATIDARLVLCSTGLINSRQFLDGIARAFPASTAREA